MKEVIDLTGQEYEDIGTNILNNNTDSINQNVAKNTSSGDGQANLFKLVSLPSSFNFPPFSCVSIIGFFASPLVCNSSDLCTSRFGRRRPFINGILFVSIFGGSLSTYGRTIGLLIWPHHLLLAQVMVTTGLIITYIYSLLMMIPARAYVMDVTPADMHSTVNSIITFVADIGGLVGFVVYGCKEAPLERSELKVNNIADFISVKRDEEEEILLIPVGDTDDRTLTLNQFSCDEVPNRISTKPKLTLEEIRSWNIFYQIYYFT
ncbi:Solute carrier family 45 member 4 [Trichoplax sp. H2]|nr:Solute carrier family 45 member 4 [Trichoplax sp. H2]|eukprot:RDD45623.1 Solute carrier family 45 member 4 [Trichoplax sp. H2]